jgi:hypothetical protein
MGTQYVCKNNERRDAVRRARTLDGHPVLNGLDYLEIDSPDQKSLAVRFIHSLPGSSGVPNVPPPPAPPLTKNNIRIEGGARVTEVRVTQVSITATNLLQVVVDQPGDFSIYTLRLVTSPDDPATPRGFDPQLAEIQFSFKVECPNDFDCETPKICPPEWTPPPEINYLAKDYASFRQVMLDRMSVQMPEWRERNAADLGIALVELLAYTADYLSYQQDAVATEAYLGTARKRVSVRRHARLMDYFMHDGSNARTWVQVRVRNDVTQAPPANPGDPPPAPRLPAGTKIFTRMPQLAVVLDPLDTQVINQAIASGAEVFETRGELPELYLQHNDIFFYTWGASECCLPKGATRATLLGTYARLKKGDVLIFKESRGPLTGEAEDADPARRHAVRLVRDPLIKDLDNNPLTDPLNGELITEIEWHLEDALPFPFCVSSKADDEHGGDDVTNVSSALGNIVLADHGRTIEAAESLGVVPSPTLRRVRAGETSAVTSATGAGASNADPEDAAGSGSDGAVVPPRFRPRLSQSPLSFIAPYPYAEVESSPGSARAALNWDLRDVQPAIELQSTFESNTVAWNPRRDLLDSDMNAPEFVVEVEDDDAVFIRFGDDLNGKRPASQTAFSAVYRVGNGTRGNVGAGALAHIATSITEILEVTNPLPARGGVEPESIEQVRQNAPVAFRTQERAVTLDDYAEVAMRRGDVQRAAATMRWTGSWHTIFLTVDRSGGEEVNDSFESDMRRHVERYRLAGHDVEIDNPRLVPLELEMEVCVEPGYFRSEVKAALLQIFSNRELPDGRRGIFHPDNFTFGQSIYLSVLYAAAESVEGVASVKIKTFQRQGNPSLAALEKGELVMSRLEIASLANDPNFPHRGIFRLTVEGGK